MPSVSSGWFSGNDGIVGIRLSKRNWRRHTCSKRKFQFTIGHCGKMIKKVDNTILETPCVSCGKPMRQCQCLKEKEPAYQVKVDDDSERTNVLGQDDEEEFLDPLHGKQHIAGRYRILGLLGRGGMGTVYKVRHETLDKIFALKILNLDVTSDVKTIKRFDQEAKSVGSLSHENLIGVHDYGISEDGVPFLVMDYLEGVELKDEIDRLGFLDERRAAAIFQKVAEGLAYAHEQGVVHRDIKPSNIMLVTDRNGNEKPIIVDFGIAKRQAVDKNLTQTGEVFGTPVYMSPEQCLGNEVDARTDIYSLGCMMYEAVSGKQPLTGENAVKTIFKQVNEEARPLNLVSTQKISKNYELLVQSCLEKDPNKRLQSAKILSTNLQKLSSGEKLSVNLRKNKKVSPVALKILQFAVVVTVSAGVLLGGLMIWQQHNVAQDNSRISKHLYDEATAKQNEGDYAAAAKLGDQALKSAETDGSKDFDKMFYERQMVYSLVQLHDYEAAAAHSRNVLRYAEATSDVQTIDQYASMTARYEESARNPKAAIEASANAVAIEKRQKDVRPKVLFDRLCAAGEICMKYKQFEQATTFLEDAVSIGDRSPIITPVMKVDANLRLFIAYMKLKNMDKAARSILQANKVAATAENNADMLRRIGNAEATLAMKKSEAVKKVEAK
jgi:serine/threonine protein kinase